MTKTVTVTKEYDDKGRLVKETTVTTTTPDVVEPVDTKPYIRPLEDHKIWCGDLRRIDEYGISITNTPTFPRAFIN